MIRWGIIGCGDVTEVKSGPGFQQAHDSALVAVMRRDAVKAADYARRHGVPRWYDDADRLIHDPEVDAVSIATPPSSHMELALRVAAAGKPALVEKPMALNHEQCAVMIAAFTKARVPLFVAYYRRALPRFLKIKQLLDDGAIGRVLSVAAVHSFGPPGLDPQHLPWRFRKEVSGGGLFVDLGCHTLDLLDFLFGPIARVAGFADRQGSGYNVEDAVVLATTHETGVQVTGRWHFNTDRHLEGVEIDGTHGCIRFSVFGQDPVIMTRGMQTESFDLPNPRTIQQPFIQTVVDHLEGRGMCASTGESAARTSRVMDQVLGTHQANSD